MNANPPGLNLGLPLFTEVLAGEEDWTVAAVSLEVEVERALSEGADEGDVGDDRPGEVVGVGCILVVKTGE